MIVKPHFSMVLEHMSRGSVYHALVEQRLFSGGFNSHDWVRIVQIAADAATGITPITYHHYLCLSTVFTV
jgi:hypothetical protein